MPISKKQPRKEQYRISTEERKVYQRMADRNSVKIRCNAEERTLLELMMKQEKWNNMSGYIRHLLFGDNVRNRLSERLINGSVEDILTYVHNTEKQLEQKEIIIISRIEKLIITAENSGYNPRLFSKMTEYLSELIIKLTEERKRYNQILFTIKEEHENSRSF